MSDFDFLYKAAIALNNTGVYLMEHGRYLEAIETLKDSIRFMKAMFFFADDKENSFDASHLTQLQSDCQGALQASYGRKSSIHHHLSGESNILVVSSQDHPLQVFDILEQCASLLCCVTIDPLNDFNTSSYDVMKQEAAIVLYNHGVAFCCHHAHRTSMSAAAVPHNGCYDVSSHKLMELSHSMTSSLMEESYMSGETSVDVPSHLFLMKLLNLRILQQLSGANYWCTDEHVHYTFAIDFMLAVISEREFLSNGDECYIMSAPAA
jgi:hypothetical protein